MVNKKWLLTGAVIIAAAIALVYLRGPRVTNHGTEGAIGAANRYQSQQMTAQDVTLDNPEMAAFIQTDTFRKIAADPALREAFRSEALSVVIGSEGLRGKTDALAAFIADEATRKLFASDKARSALDAGVFRSVDVRELASSRAEAVRWLDSYSRLASDEATRKLFHDGAAFRTSDELRSRATEMGIAKHAELAKLLADSYTGKAVEAGLHTLLADQGRLADAMDALRMADVWATARVEGLQAVIDGSAGSRKTVDALAAVANDQALVAALQNHYVLEAAHHTEFTRLAEANRLSEALSAKMSE